MILSSTTFVWSTRGAADATATVTWLSAEVAARLNPLPNCSFMFQSFDSRIFELGDCFMAQSSPGWAILSVITQGRRVDATLLQIDLQTVQSVFVPQDWPTLQTLSHCQLSKKYLLWNPTVWHAHNVIDPSKLRFKHIDRQLEEDWSHVPVISTTNKCMHTNTDRLWIVCRRFCRGCCRVSGYLFLFVCSEPQWPTEHCWSLFL